MAITVGSLEEVTERVSIFDAACGCLQDLGFNVTDKEISIKGKEGKKKMTSRVLITGENLTGKRAYRFNFEKSIFVPEESHGSPIKVVIMQ